MSCFLITESPYLILKMGFRYILRKEILANSGWMIKARQAEAGARIDIYRAEEKIGQRIVRPI